MSKKGYKQTEEHIKKRAEKLSGLIRSEETRGKIRKASLGKKYSEERCKKMSESKMGHFVSKETGEKIRLSKLGKKRPDMVGEKNPKWITDRSLLQKSDRNGKSSACTEWRMKVYKRDGFKCRINNNDCSGKIEAHHILRWKEYPELRYDINNGITLCHFHHPRKKNEETKLSPYFQELVIK